MKTFVRTVLFFAATNYGNLRGIWWEFTRRLNTSRKIKVLKNKEFQFASSGLITRRIYEQESFVNLNKAFEQRTLSLIQQLMKPDWVALDIGANIGLHSLVMASCLDKNGSGRVYSFEPSKDTFETLERNIKLNSVEHQVRANRVALSNQAGNLYLATPAEYQSLGKDSDPYKSLVTSERSPGNGELVEVLRLDDWAKHQHIGQLDLIKIDIEGAELDCFRGGLETLRCKRPVVIMECYEQYCRRFNYSVADVVLFMNDLNYKMFQYEESQWIALPAETDNSILDWLFKN